MSAGKVLLGLALIGTVGYFGMKMMHPAVASTIKKKKILLPDDTEAETGEVIDENLDEENRDINEEVGQDDQEGISTDDSGGDSGGGGGNRTEPILPVFVPVVVPSPTPHSFLSEPRKSLPIDIKRGPGATTLQPHLSGPTSGLSGPNLGGGRKIGTQKIVKRAPVSNKNKALISADGGWDNASGSWEENWGQ